MMIKEIKIRDECLKCWEYFNCNKVKCPTYQSKDLRCWLISETYCHDEIQGTWLEKMEACIQCEVFKSNFKQKDLRKTLSLISKQFNQYKHQIQKNQQILEENQKKLEEFKRTSVYLLKEVNKKSEELLLERKNLENRVKKRTEELHKIQEKLIQSTKMVAIGRFSAGIAHEINNPLGAIINHVRTLLANPEIRGENKGYLELTLKGLFRIENIIRQILSFSGGQKSESALTNVNKIVSDTFSLVKHKFIEKQIRVDFLLTDNLPKVFVDPFQIQQVINNILNNAFDVLDKNGKLKIETHLNNNEVIIHFIDNGKGMAKEDIEKVFDPFFTTKEVGKGTGLGLFICYNILQIYKGTIDIKSKKGKGTRVAIRLPVPEDN